MSSMLDDFRYEQQAAAMGIDTTRQYLPAHLRHDGPAPLTPIGENYDEPTRIEAENERDDR